MAVSHAFRKHLTFIILTILLKPSYCWRASSYVANVSVDQLKMFFAGQCASIIKYEVFMVHTRNASHNNESISYLKRISRLLLLSKFVLLAKLNISMCLLFCGDIESNPEPDDFINFNLHQKGLCFGQ